MAAPSLCVFQVVDALLPKELCVPIDGMAWVAPRAPSRQQHASEDAHVYQDSDVQCKQRLHP